jgi:L,D-peptidoglycan transpeptidase YkuD (ErfK/YbiS/YcfS/YnhG family)
LRFRGKRGASGGDILGKMIHARSLDLVLTPLGLRFRGLRFPCTIGRGGLTDDKREGDGATPRGVHRIVGCLYRPDRMRRPVPWARAIAPGDLWSDDVADPDYNHLVAAPHGFGHEVMRRADPMYDLVLVVDWNWPDATVGRGSAIFVHQWRGPGRPTAGCVALRRDHLRWITQRIGPETRLVIA